VADQKLLAKKTYIGWTEQMQSKAIKLDFINLLKDVKRS
jgi:hypothetical protein